ncbi:Stabilin-1 Fasciclin [Triplophysa tibetana]|uniref:Stabilin-1 Fasciclin n=1 Tax=Triplophysa tibetana TaxID=1572043 RepID=A0A5A9NSF8_9TELE|nr:Stabilin-1 Fasciclin [Triplophysa tibetana]
MSYLLIVGLVLLWSSQFQATPNRCDTPRTILHTTPCTSCAASPAVNCPRGFRKTSKNAGNPGCSYVVELGNRQVELSGCSHTCEKVATEQKCCPDFWGPLCLPCPTWSGKTCNGYGTCVSGDSGNGTCVCEEGYTGFACQECSNKNAYGDHCSSGLLGFVGDGKHCVPINPCDTNNGGCQKDSTTCEYTGPGKSKCVCLPGTGPWDALTGCLPKSACTSSSCHSSATCETSSDGTPRCICNAQQIGDGRRCYGNLFERVMELEREGGKANSGSLRMLEKGCKLTLSQHGPFTFFMPMEFKTVLGKSTAIMNEFCKHHLILGQRLYKDLEGNDLWTYGGEKIRFKTNKQFILMRDPDVLFTILESDIPASNGIIHIIDKPFTLAHIESSDNNIEFSSKTIGEIFREDERFNRFLSLVDNCGTQLPVRGLGPLTVFVPTNKAIDRFRDGSVIYMLSDAKPKLQMLLKHHMFSLAAVTVDQLASMSEIITMANEILTINISGDGRVFLSDKGIPLEAKDIVASNGIIHLIDGVLVPSSIVPIMPHRCDVNASKIVMENPLRGCELDPDPRWSYSFAETGCAKYCNSTQKRAECCSGFYGPDCKPCIGGFQHPCYDKGTCFDGMAGNGSCKCEPQFKGIGCHICAHPKKHGDNCDEDCRCVHGDCDNRPGSVGVCRRGSCAEGYSGELCDQIATPCNSDSVFEYCHIHAKCVYRNDQTMCVCQPGYEGDGYTCTEANLCLKPDRGGCHPNAGCMYEGGKVNCVCTEGWTGDGILCVEINNCQLKNLSGCHEHADCTATGPGQNECSCKKGYMGDGVVCKIFNPCLTDNGGCHSQELDGNSEFKNFNRFLQKHLVINSDSRVTALVPPIAAFRNLSSSEEDFWFTYYRLPHFLRVHFLDGIYTSEDLKQQVGKTVPTMGKTKWGVQSKGKDLMIGDATIVVPDLKTINGCIHIIDMVLQPPLSDIPPPPPSLMEVLNNTQEFSLFCQAALLYNLERSIPTNDFTIFIPNDSAIRDYLNKTNSTQLSLDIVKYHVVISEHLLPNHLGDGIFKTTFLDNGTQIMFYVDTDNQTMANDVPLNGTFIEMKRGSLFGIPRVLDIHKNLCSKDVVLKVSDHSCCPGFFGHNCFKCPGTVGNWCSNNGQCNDGLYGSGECLCNEGFHGTACEMCEPGRYGQDCKSAVSLEVQELLPFAPARLGMKAMGQSAKKLTHAPHTMEDVQKTQTVRRRCPEKETANVEVATLATALCVSNNGGCSFNAICKNLGNGERNCSCYFGYKGDGFQCAGTVSREFLRKPEAAWFRRNLGVLGLRDLFGSGPFTVFVPHTDYVVNLTVEAWLNKSFTPELLRNHIVGCEELRESDLRSVKEVVSSSGHKLRFSVKNGVVHINDNAKIITSDYECTNGVIHFIDKVIFPFELPVNKPEKRIDLNVTAAAEQYGFKIFSKLLQDADMMHVVLHKPFYPFTMFWPTDDVFNNLPEARKTWLYTEEHRDKLQAYLKSHIVRDQKTTALALPSEKKVTTLFGTEITFSCNKDSIGDILIGGNNARIVSRNMPFESGIAHGIDQLLEPPSIGARCDDFDSTETKNKTSICRRSNSHYLSRRPFSSGYYRYPALYSYGYGHNPFISSIGCNRVCTKMAWTFKCCKNHYGKDCQVCPGGLEAPCGERANCDDGYDGTGRCKCHPGFTGTACELCEKNHFGPNCTACNCTKKGKCDEGLDGNGSCFCLEGWTGTFCETVIVCHPGNQCECVPPYEGNGVNCTAPDLCIEYNGGCHDQADCLQTGINITCSCLTGYSGDGYDCSPINPCVVEANGGCSDFAQCIFTRPNERSCQCLQGYVGNGFQCLEKVVPPVDRCLEDNGGCDPEASCKDLHFHTKTAGVFHLRPSEGKYKLNFSKAQEACEKEGAELATISQMSDAQQLGMHMCVAGWMAGQKVGYPIRFPSAKCGDNHVGIVLYKEPVNVSWTYDAYCYSMREVACECGPGYIGNGEFCNGDLASVVATTSNFSAFYSTLLRYAEDTEEGKKLLNLLSDVQANITVFVPHNDGFGANQTLSWRDLQYHVSAINNVHYFEDFKNDTVIPSRLGSDLVVMIPSNSTSQSQDSQPQKMVNEEVILVWNIPAINGLIHVIGRPFRAPSLHVAPVLPVTQSSSVAVTTVFIILVIIVLVAGLGYYVFKHKNDAFRFQYFKNDDEDGSSTKGSGNPALVSIPNPCYSGYRAFAEPFGDSAPTDTPNPME